jgi:hypothetical protein
MFRRLGEFGYQRGAVQAIGFYLVYFFAGIIVSGILGGIFGMATGANGLEEGMQAGLKVGMIFAIFLSAVLSFAILRAKGQLRNVVYLLVGLLSVGAAWLGGLLFGLIFVAFLTTRPASPEIDALARPIEGVAAH